MSKKKPRYKLGERTPGPNLTPALGEAGLTPLREEERVRAWVTRIK